MNRLLHISNLWMHLKLLPLPPFPPKSAYYISNPAQVLRVLCRPSSLQCEMPLRSMRERQALSSRLARWSPRGTAGDRQEGAGHYGRYCGPCHVPCHAPCHGQYHAAKGEPPGGGEARALRRSGDGDRRADVSQRRPLASAQRRARVLGQGAWLRTSGNFCSPQLFCRSIVAGIEASQRNPTCVRIGGSLRPRCALRSGEARHDAEHHRWPPGQEEKDHIHRQTRGSCWARRCG
jgi:hypothetical protein